MIYNAADFTFEVPQVVSRARRVLIKPCASVPEPYPASTSTHLLGQLISGIRQVSDADIIILEGTLSGEPIAPVYEALSYNFPRVLTLDVKDCVFVEVDNPLPKALILPTFWIPNVILSSDFLITVSPMKVADRQCALTIANLLTLLPGYKYQDETCTGLGVLYNLGIDKVLADLYFTLPFDMGIVESRDASPSGTEGKIFVGEPYDVDREVCSNLNIKAEYLELIRVAKADIEQ